MTVRPGWQGGVLRGRRDRRRLRARPWPHRDAGGPHWVYVADAEHREDALRRALCGADGLGWPLVKSAFAIALVTGQSVNDVSYNVMAGSPIRCSMLTRLLVAEVIAERESRSRPDFGIATVRTTGPNQHEVSVMVEFNMI